MNTDPTRKEPSRATAAVIGDWIREEIKDADQVSIPELANKAVEHFAKDHGFIKLFLMDMLRPVVYDVTKRVVGQTRDWTMAGDQIVNLDEVEKRANLISSRFLKWVEHAGDRSVRLMCMTKSDLTQAADERRKRGQHELHLSALWDALGERMKSGQVVADVWSPEEIEAVSERLKAKNEGAQ